MCEIIFRGKRVDNGKWVYGDLIHYENGEVAIIQKKFSKFGYEATEIHYRIKVIPETVGQFTGLVDKNGTKIFKGDIVHCVARLDEADCIVVYDDGEFRLVAEDRYKDYPTLGGYYAVHCFEKEVIGNIYDNKEQPEGSKYGC